MATTCKLIAKTALGSDTSYIEFTSIPGTGYTDLLLVASVRSTRAAIDDGFLVRVNGSSTSYSYRYLEANTDSGVSSGNSGSATAFYVGVVGGSSVTADTFSSLEVYIPNYAGSTNKSMSATMVLENNGRGFLDASAGLWANTNAITEVRIFPNTGPNLKAGSSAYLYGITKA